MGDYHDYTMNSPADDQTKAGICHARGFNADLPPVWLIYITVENVDEAAARCRSLGGKIVVAPKGMGAYGRYCVIQDPAGAHAALFEPKK